MADVNGAGTGTEADFDEFMEEDNPGDGSGGGGDDARARAEAEPIQEELEDYTHVAVWLKSIAPWQMKKVGAPAAHK